MGGYFAGVSWEKKKKGLEDPEKTYLGQLLASYQCEKEGTEKT